MRFGSRAAAGLCLLLTLTPLSAQAPTSDCSIVFGKVINSFAAFHHVEMHQLLVDTTRSGRAVSRLPVSSRPRVVPLNGMREQAKALGFTLTADAERLGLPGGTPPGVPLDTSRPAAAVIVLGPTIIGDSADVRVRYVLTHPGEQYDESGIMRFILHKGSGVWDLTSSVIEVADIRRRD